MKTLSTLASALLIMALGNPVLSHSRPEQASQGEQKPKLMNLKGMVKSDGDKITFVADDTGKTWDVVNSGDPKGSRRPSRRSERSRIC